MYIKEAYNRDFINVLIADMDNIGYDYKGTDNRGRLVFDSKDGNSSQAFPDWDEVKKYLENGSFPYEFESCMKENHDVKADDIDFIMNKYVDDKPVSGSYGSYDKIEITDNKGNGKYTVSCNGYSVDIDFDLDDDSAQYVYYIEGEGPYAHNSYEYITKDVAHYIDWAVRHYGEDDDLEESQCLVESRLPEWQDSIMKEIREALEKVHIYAEIYDDYDFNGDDDAFVVCVQIENGDWKHDHRQADLVVADTVNNYDNMEVTKVGEEITQDSDDDSYSSIHKFHIIRYPDDNGFDFDNDKQLDIKFSTRESVKRKNRKFVKESNSVGLNDVIKNAKKTAKRDGYNQDVYIDKNGEYGFVRHYPNNLADWNGEKLVGQVQVKWDRGIPNIIYVDDESLFRKESVSNKNRKSVTESIDLTDYKFKFSTKDGYKIYSKFDKTLNKGLWVAQKEGEEPFEITYEQARGFEPINPTDRALQHKVRQALKMESKSIKENCKDDLKKFADANKDKLSQIAQKNGFRLYNDYYCRNTTVDRNYTSVLCFDFDEVNSKADVDKFERALDRYFNKFDCSYFLELLPRVKRICIYC